MNQANKINPKYVGIEARRRYRPARIIICGIPSAGKSWAALHLMRGLVGNKGRFSVFDTDFDAGELYGDLMSFNVVPLAEFRPQDVPDMMATKAAEGYDGVIIDSLSDFWSGNGGELDQVDRLSKEKYKNNSQPAWKEVGQYRQDMLDATRYCGMHFIGTMLLKPETVTYKDERSGKMVTEKVGMKPDQKEFLERHYDVVLSVNQRHEIFCERSRYYEVLRDNQMVDCSMEELGRRIVKWLRSADAEAAGPERAPVRGRTDDRQAQDLRQDHGQPEHRRSEHQPQQERQQSRPAAESKTTTTPAESIKIAEDAWDNAVPPAAAWLQHMWTQVLGWARKENSAEAVAVLRELYAGRTKGLAPDAIVNGSAIKKVRTKSSWNAVVTNPASKPMEWIAALMEHAVPGQGEAISNAVGRLDAARAASWGGELASLPVEERASYVREVLKSGWRDESRGGAQ